MPSIPEYNQGATEEAGLTRAKRRVIANMQSGIVKMTERPDEDLTGGDADVIAKSLISQFEDLTALFRQISAYFGSGESGQIFLDEASDIIKAFGVVIASSKAIARILRTAKALVPLMRYMDLGILSDLKAVQAECHESATDAFRALRIIDFSDAVPLEQAESEMGDMMYEMYGSEPSYDPNEPDGATFDSDEYSIQSAPTGGLPSKVSSRRGRPIVPGSKTDLLQQANQALRDLKRTELDRRMQEEGKRILFEQLELDRQNEVPKDEMATDDVSVLTEEDRTAVDAGKQVFKKLDRRTFETLVDTMGNNLSMAMDRLEEGYRNFNKYRKQRVLRSAKDVDVGNEIKTASGMPRVMYRGQMYSRDVRPGDRRATEAEELAKRGGFNMVQGSNARMGGRVYKVGGSTDLLYEREGLPRFL